MTWDGAIDNDFGRPQTVHTNSAHTHPVAENVVNRESEVPEMNRIWSSDFTYLATAEGWL